MREKHQASRHSFDGPNRYNFERSIRVVGETVGVKSEFNVELLELVENEKAAWRSSLGGFGKSSLSRTKTGTKLKFIVNYALPYSIVGKILDRLMVSRQIEKSVERGLQKLKSSLEK